MLIDTHAHLYWEDYKDDLDQVIDRAMKAGVDTIINIGVDLKTSQQIVNFTHPKVAIYAHIGIHPHEASKYHNNLELLHSDIAQLEQLLINNPGNIIGIGECGLDYFFQSNDMHKSELSPETQKHLQKQLLQAQIDLAKKHQLPLSIHCRDDRSVTPPISAWEEVFDYLTQTTGILHCYSGLPEHTQLALNSNYLISFAGNITYPKNDYLREIIKQLPLDRIALETDCPFLSPQAQRGQRNEPAAIKQIAEVIAQLKNTTVEEVAIQTTANVKKLYHLY